VKALGDDQGWNAETGMFHQVLLDTVHEGYVFRRHLTDIFNASDSMPQFLAKVLEAKAPVLTKPSWLDHAHLPDFFFQGHAVQQALDTGIRRKLGIKPWPFPVDYVFL
jgi:hypothetical protein